MLSHCSVKVRLTRQVCTESTRQVCTEGTTRAKARARARLYKHLLIRRRLGAMLRPSSRLLEPRNQSRRREHRRKFAPPCGWTVGWGRARGLLFPIYTWVCENCASMTECLNAQSTNCKKRQGQTPITLSSLFSFLVSVLLFAPPTAPFCIAFALLLYMYISRRICILEVYVYIRGVFWKHMYTRSICLLEAYLYYSLCTCIVLGCRC